MTFELHTEPAPADLAPLGQLVEIHELPYGQMREVMHAGDKPGESAERLLGASLFVDGQPFGYGPLLALPGRFSGAITSALEQTMRMHGLTRTVAPDVPTAAPAEAASGPNV